MSPRGSICQLHCHRWRTKRPQDAFKTMAAEGPGGQNGKSKWAHRQALATRRHIDRCVPMYQWPRGYSPSGYKTGQWLTRYWQATLPRGNAIPAGSDLSLQGLILQGWRLLGAAPQWTEWCPRLRVLPGQSGLTGCCPAVALATVLRTASL